MSVCWCLDRERGPWQGERLDIVCRYRGRKEMKGVFTTVHLISNGRAVTMTDSVDRFIAIP